MVALSLTVAIFYTKSRQGQVNKKSIDFETHEAMGNLVEAFIHRHAHTHTHTHTHTLSP